MIIDHIDKYLEIYVMSIFTIIVFLLGFRIGRISESYNEKPVNITIQNIQPASELSAINCNTGLYHWFAGNNSVGGPYQLCCTAQFVAESQLLSSGISVPVIQPSWVTIQNDNWPSPPARWGIEK
jgi:hypothetical protein